MEKLPYKECENCKDWNGNIANCMAICPKPIKALKELQKYRQIGTVDECRAAMEKQIPQKPEMIEAQSQGLIGDGTHTDKVSYQSDVYECPKCGSFLGFKIDCCDDENYQDCFCSACGQALKWGD